MVALPDAIEVTPELVRDLVDRYGSPLYVYDGGTLVASLAELTGALHPAMEVFYSLKANPNISVCALLHAHGARAEVSSVVELRTALTVGVDPYDVIFLGPGKSLEDLQACLDAGIYAVVVESFGELDALQELCAARGLRQRVLLRVNPATSTPGSRLTMGGKPRQFGIDEAQVLAAGDLPGRYPALHLAGVHGYLGTRILDAATVVANTAKVLDLAERIAAATGIALDAVDVGGGFGVAYFDNESDLDPVELRAGLAGVVEPFVERHPGVRLLVESGRYLTARAGMYVTGVRYVKESVGRRFAVLDGGTHHHMAAVGVGSYVKRNFPLVALTGRDAVQPGPHGSWMLAGVLCTPNDTVAKDAALPDLVPGDLVAVLRSGAYGPSASPGLFLSHGYPAEVLVHGGRALLVRDRDTLDDLLRPQHHHTFEKPATQPALTAEGINR